jgi:hypothetical protein
MVNFTFLRDPICTIYKPFNNKIYEIFIANLFCQLCLQSQEIRESCLIGNQYFEAAWKPEMLDYVPICTFLTENNGEHFYFSRKLTKNTQFSTG